MMQPISRARNYWTAEEDQILKEEATLQVNTTGNVKNWSIIATKLKSRTNKDCRKRWSKLQTNVNKGIWSSEEDHRLRKAVEKRGLSWTLVAQDVQTRHADQCAKRWYHFLDPNLIRDDWNEEEDVRLLEAVQARGRAWREISEKEFPRRSSTDLKNRYIILQRRRLNARGKSPVSSTSPSLSTNIASPPSGPSTALSSGMTYGSDSDSDSGELSQNTSPADFQAFDGMDNVYDFPSSGHFPTEEMCVDMSLLPDIIDTCPGLFDPLGSQFPTGMTGTDCSPPLCGMAEPSGQVMTHVPEQASFSSLYSPSDNFWLGPCSQMHVDPPMNPSPSDSSEYNMHTLPSSIMQGEAHTYNLNLEGVHPLILSQIMDIVLTSQQQVKVKLSSAEP